LEQTKELAAHAEKAGAHGIALMPPFFFKVRLLSLLTVLEPHS
jgi:dihydrodipicolinate synthase/N-acetylneuraminate lyase